MNYNMIKSILGRFFRLSRKITTRLSSISQKISRHISNFIKTKHIKISTAEVFFQHNGENDFHRYDMIVRLLAIENYYGKNDYGFDYYLRMQGARKECKLAQKGTDRFRTLIASYETKGYDDKSEIELDSNLQLIDGSHRLALAMYYKQSVISAKVRSYKLDTYYDIAWFRANDFSTEECKILHDRYLQLYEELKQPFVCTLWHPVRKYYDEITEKLSLFGNVLEVRDLTLSEEDYRYYTRGVYAVDDIEKWKIEKKIGYMIADKSDRYCIRMVSLSLNEPQFRLKTTTNGTLSKRCELIKSVIRNAYKNRMDNYFHDIIMHIGDNFYQNRHIYKFLTMPMVDISSVFEHIKDYDYVLTKMDVDYMPKDFPKHYPLGKDIDVLCADIENFDSIVDLIWVDVKTLFDNKYFSTRIWKRSNSRKQIRIEQEGYPVFIFDCSYILENSVDGTSNLICENKQQVNGYYIPNNECEVLVRFCDIKSHPEKKRHKDYIFAHKQDINHSLLEKQLTFNWNKII